MRRALTVISIAAILTSCGGSADSVTAPPGTDRTPATVSLSDSEVSLELGFSHQLTALVRSSSGVVLSGIAIDWTSDNPSVATVFGGNVAALATGSAVITATAGGRSGKASFSVIPAIVRSIQISRTAATLAPGRTLQLVANPLDAHGRIIADRAVAFSSSNPAVGQVTAEGLVSTADTGQAVISASSGDAQTAFALRVTNPTNILLPVSAIAPAGMPQPDGYSLQLRHPDDSLSAAFAWGSTGSLTGSMTLAEQLQLVAVAAGAPSWPARSMVARQDMPASVPVVFIPQSVTLTSGAFAGSSVGTSMSAAFAPCLQPGNQCNGGFFPPSFRTGVKRWGSFPVPVAFATGIDSAVIWEALRAFEAAVGRQLFMPDTGGSFRKIMVRPGLPPGASGFGGYAQWTWDANDEMAAATVWFAATPTRYLVQHEFTHALGFGHTCAWSSVMGGYGCASAPEVSPVDMAHMLLASAVYDAELPLRLPDGTLPCGTLSLQAAVQDPSASMICWRQFDFSRATAEPDTERTDAMPLRQESMP